jgi:hypothetical protein
MSDRKLLKRVKRFGATNFESVKETAKRQADLLCRLRENGRDDPYIGLNDCRPDFCGLVRCSAGCWFNLRRRWLNGVFSAYKLFCHIPATHYEVRIIPQAWQRPSGKLGSMNIQSAKQFLRRRLDTRNGRQAIMIGSYKVGKEPYVDRWIGEIHALVGGIDKFGLRRALQVPFREADSYLYVNEISDLPNTLLEVLRPGERVWQPPYAAEPSKVPGKKQRAEYYRWLLCLESDERLLRYGCDRYFRPIAKTPRPIVAKVTKPRPNPYWLRPYRFGSHDDDCTCLVCRNRQD